MTEMMNGERGRMNGRRRQRRTTAVHRSSFIVHRSGFTLLEVVLTLMIATLLVAAIGAAVNIHLRVVEAGRTEVEQAQLARALLRRISDDLRGAVPVVKKDSSSSTDAMASAASAAAGAAASGGASGSSSTGGGTGGGTSTGGGSTGGTTGATSAGSASSGSAGRSTSGSSGTGGSSAGGGTSGGGTSGGSAGGNSSGGGSQSGSNSSTSSSAAEDETPQQPNFYGSQFQLQLDVGRVPSVHQFASMTSDAALSGSAQPADTLSDIRTVNYFVGAASSQQTSADPFALAAPMQTNVGLIRNELSRAASQYSYSQGGGSGTTTEKLLATEVVALQFQYYDGSQWLTDWDSSSTQSLPVCVEVLMTLRSSGPGASLDPLSLLTASNQIVERTYRVLVHVPGATASSSTSSSTDSSSSSSSTGTAQ
jgi:prepilin-type N-terminal cleavage/methylation domain-containing protein